MGESMKQYLKTRNYSARGQSANRVHRFQYLEKKKGWKERARRNKSRVDLISSLAEKSRTKNPEEFSCKMLSTVHGEKIGKKGGKVFKLDREKAVLLQGNNVSSEGAQKKVDKIRKKIREREKDIEKKGSKFLLLKKQILQKRLKKDACENPLIFKTSSSSRKILEEEVKEEKAEIKDEKKANELREEPQISAAEEQAFKWERKRKRSLPGSGKSNEKSSEKSKFSSLSQPEEHNVHVTDKLSENLEIAKRIKHLAEKIELKVNLDGKGKRFQIKADQNTSKLPSYKWFGERKR